MLSEASTVPWLPLFIVLTLAPVVWYLFRALASPLNAIPGPWLARFSDLPYFYHSAVRQQQAQYVESLHRKYRRLVRIAPNEIGVASIEGIKAIHKIGAGFAKAPWYDYIAMTEANHGPPGLFQMRDFHEHAARRKLLARGFTTSILRSDWEDMVREKARKAVAAIKKEKAQGNPVDVRKWWLIMANDVVSEVVFGKSFGGLESGRNSTFSEAIVRANRINMLALNLPFVFKIAKHLPIPALRSYFAAFAELEEIASAAVEHSRSESTGRNVFSKIIAQGEKDSSGDSGRLTDRQITIEAGNLISAGSDTTAETLVYLVWAVLSRPDLQRQLQHEVANVEEMMQDSELEKLPILGAVIHETLRVYPASPFPQPRVVPKGGFAIEGHHLSEGAVVSTTPWMTHRNPDIFPDPETFDHTRWLPNGSAVNSEATKAGWWPFGAGARVCLGRHLAMMEIRMATAMFFGEFKGAKLAPETTETTMAMNNFVMVHPAGGECKVLLA